MLLALESPCQADGQPYYLRNYNPFLQVFGLPAPEGGSVTSPGRLSGRFTFNLTNHADSGETGAEMVLVDGESYSTDLVLRFGMAPRWEVGLDIPYVSHHNGLLDNVIETWHQQFGLDNSERRRPSNQLRFEYVRDGSTLTDLHRAGGGIGDVRISAGYQLASTDSGRSLALRGTVKIPTGDSTRLRGSGATDVAVSMDVTDRATLAGRSMELYGQAGLLRLGDGDVLSDQQRHTVPFASLGIGWHWRSNVDLRLQLAAQGEYFDSALPEIGAGSTTLAAGAVIKLRRLGLELDIAMIEDLISDAAPDFALYASIRRVSRVGAVY